MKKNIQNIIMVIGALATTVMLLLVCSKITEYKNSYIKNHDFISSPEDYDVLLFGTSHVINGVIPMQLWEEQGISAYNLAGHAHTIPTSYWVMRTALKYNKPKLVVLDGDGIRKNDKATKESFMHESFDIYPLSFGKIEAMRDLFSEEADKKIMSGFIFKYAAYHARWTDIEKKDFFPEIKPMNGAEYLLKISANTLPKPASEPLKEDTLGIDYMKKFIEYAKSENVEVLLTYLPSKLEEDELYEPATVEKIAEEYGVGFINLVDAGVVDPDKDFANSSHLNIDGATKVSSYLGEYIMKNYNIKDHRNDENYEYLNQRCKEFTQYRMDEKKSLTERYE